MAGISLHFNHVAEEFWIAGASAARASGNLALVRAFEETLALERALAPLWREEFERGPDTPQSAAYVDALEAVDAAADRANRLWVQDVLDRVRRERAERGDVVPDVVSEADAGADTPAVKQ